MWLLALLGVAAADPAAILADAGLSEVLDGNPPAAIARYERLVRDFPVDQPAHGRALLALGRTHYRLGDFEAARQALLAGARTTTARSECLALLSQLEVEVGAISELPTHWTFDNDEHGLVHPWQHEEQGSLRISSGTNPGLQWISEPSDEADLLLLGISPKVRPSRLRFHIGATPPTRIRLLAVDYQGEVISLSRELLIDSPHEVVVPLNDLQFDQIRILHLGNAAQKKVVLTLDDLVVE